MSIVIKPTDEKSNFRSLATADYKWMITQGTFAYKFTAFEDNTRLFVNGSLNTTLSKQTITSISLAAGDIVSSDKSFSFVSSAGGDTGICYGWEGTIFGHRVDRYSPTFYITATRRDATVTITRQTSGTVVVNNASVAKDSLYTYNSSDTDDQYIITSNYPIACYVDDQEGEGKAADSLPLFPPATDLFGTFSGGGHIIASQASTSYNGYGTGGSTISGTLSSIGSATETIIAGGNNFSGESSRVIADKPIFAESQADGDGGEMTPFVSKEAFGTQFVIPNSINEWVKLVSDVPANYEVFNTSGTSVGTGTLAGVDISGVEGGIYNAYLGSATPGSALTAQGNLIVTDQPVYAVFESIQEDETILFAKAPVNNTSTHVNPKIVTDGLVLALDAANSKSYPGSGSTWTDLSGNGNHGTNANMTFETDNKGVFDFNDTSSVSTIANSTSLNPTSQLTIESVVNFDGNTNDFIFEKGDVNTQYSLFSHNTDIVFRTYHDGDGTYNTLLETKANAHITNGVYHHIVGSWDGSTKRIYVDGILRASASKSGNLVTTSPGAAVGRFGGTTTGYYFGGKIARVNVYNKGLSAAEVLQNFQALRSRFGI